MEASFVRLSIWFFVFIRLITVQKVIDNARSPNITIIQFFKSQYHSNGRDAVIKQIGLADVVYFEIVDHFDTPEHLLNWPINCWIIDSSSNETKSSEGATKFIKNGCQIPDVSMYYNYPIYAIRVGFTLVSAGLKEIEQYSTKFFKVQCEYIKCDRNDDKNATEYPQCVFFDHCTGSVRPKYDEKHLQIASSETLLYPVPKNPEEIKFPLADAKPQQSKDAGNQKSDDCDCSKEINICMSTQKHHDGRMTLPVVAAVSFASFSIGVLLMAGLCWIGAGQKSSAKDQSKTRYPSVKFVPSSPSNENILNWSSTRSIATYTSVVADVDQRP